MKRDNLTKRPIGRRRFLYGIGAAALGAGTAGLVSSGSLRHLANDPLGAFMGSSQEPALLDLPRIQWEGGPDYWRRFTKAADAGWTDPSFFPLAVFFGRAAHAENLKSLGINTFQGVEHNAPLKDVTSKGIFCIVQNEFSADEIGDDPKVVGLFANDECDIGLGCSGSNTDENLTDMRQQVSTLRSRSDGRFVNANYSKGVLDSFWAQGNMDDFMQVVDVASADNYAYTSPHVGNAIAQSPHWKPGTSVMRAATYGWLVDRMRAYQNPGGEKPNWMFVETAMPFLEEPGARTISPEELEGACWSAIIHEARGIMFFQHNNDGINGGYSLVECSETRRELIRAANAKITALARVINTQTYIWDFGPGLDTMLKALDGSAYVFAEIALATNPGTRTFTLPPSITTNAVEVVGEGRSIRVLDGKFTDTFRYEYTHHVYRTTL